MLCIVPTTIGAMNTDTMQDVTFYVICASHVMFCKWRFCLWFQCTYHKTTDVLEVSFDFSGAMHVLNVIG